MGYWIESKKINISLTNQEEQQIIEKLKEKMKESNRELSISWVRENIIFHNNLDNIFQHLGIDFERNENRVKLLSQQIKLETFQSLFFDLFDGIVKPGSYITWKGEDGEIFGRFYTPTMIRFDGYKELKKIKEPFILQKKLNNELDKKEIAKLKTKI